MEGRPLEDQDAELIERARHGDVDAYERLVRRYQSLAARTAYLVLREPSEAEDAVQEAFVKAYHALERFRGDASFRPWLLRIVANEASNRRRAAGRRARLALRLAADRPSGDAAPSPEEAVLAGERRELLLRAVNEMSHQDQMVIGCRYFLGLSERETAETLRVPRGTVKSRLSRALGRLRDVLAEAPEGSSLPGGGPTHGR